MADAPVLSILRSAFGVLAAGQDEFRRLDAAAGDGDLGVSVAAAALATVTWLDERDEVGPTAEVLTAFAAIWDRESPSTFGSLVARGLRAAAGALPDGGEDAVAQLSAALAAAIAMIERRGGAALGDKTFLDVLVPGLEAARSTSTLEGALVAMHGAAVEGVERTKDAVSKHGRAAWVGERGRGVPDAGSVVVIRLLEAIGGSAIADRYPEWAPSP